VIGLPRKKLPPTALAPKRTATIGVIGSKGGVGATTLAINLAASIAQDGKDDNQAVLLVDANFQQPDVALFLACEAKHTVIELLHRSVNLEPQTILACCGPAPGCNDLRILTAPPDGRASAAHNLTQLSACLPPLQNLFPTVVIDLPKTLDKHLVSMLDQCDLVILVVAPDLASIAATTRWYSLFDELGYPQEKILLIGNRTGGKSKLMDEQMQKTFGQLLTGKIPNTYALAESSAISGAPLVVAYPRESYAKAMKSVSQSIEDRLARQVQRDEVWHE